MASVTSGAGNLLPTVRRAIAFRHWSSVGSRLSRFAALACRRDDLGAGSTAGFVATGSVSFWVKSGNSSGEDNGPSDGRDTVLNRLFGVSLSNEGALAVC